MDYKNEPKGVYAVIDNKSFYATVECSMRRLDPLKTPLVVMSEAHNTGSGLIMAASPMAKKIFHIKNVSRGKDLPRDPRIIVVPPRMNLYIKKNLAVNKIFSEFVAPEDLLPYSIDESILNLTHSWQLFGNNLLEVVRKIQHEVKTREHLLLTVGLGNNPLQAKIALDVYAKHNREFIGVITNETVPNKIWTISELMQVWGIGERTKKHLNKLSIYNMYDLAHCNPYFLKKEMGIMGTQLYATAWGIDRTDLSEPLVYQDKSIGNSQVLARDYSDQKEIETVIKEIGAQVAARLRAQDKQCQGVYLAIGYSFESTDELGYAGFAHSLKMDVSTAETNTINAQLIWIFRQFWDTSASVRTVAVSCTRLSPRFGEQTDLFNTRPNQMMKLEETMDIIRHRFGKTSIVRASSLTKGGTFIERSKLVGGHNGGNSLE